MQPNSTLGVDDIRLGDLEFWLSPLENREGAFRTLRRERPVSFHEEPELPMLGKGPGFWAVTRFADVLEASRNAETFSSGRQGVNIIDQPPELNEFFGSMIAMDDPRHARLRRIVSRGFTPGMLRKAEADVDRAATEVIDDVLEKGSCDFVTEIAAPFPLKIICEMMGIPPSEHRFVFDRSNIILGAGDPEYVSDINEAIPALFRAGQELAALVENLAEERKKNPTEDLTSALIHADVEGERLTGQELGSFFILLVVAGNETTRNAISHGMKALCDHPDQRRILASDFDAVAPTAVEEIVRWATPVIHFRRTATRDTVLGGQKIRENEKVVLWYNSANRDELAFPDPYRFDIRRSPNEHAGFGGPGPHFCLGAHLARREITVMFRQLFSRLPDLEITGEPEFLRSFFINGIKHMQCEFTAGGAARARAS
jgi:cytochrome P450